MIWVSVGRAATLAMKARVACRRGRRAASGGERGRGSAACACAEVCAFVCACGRVLEGWWWWS